RRRRSFSRSRTNEAMSARPWRAAAWRIPSPAMTASTCGIDRGAARRAAAPPPREAFRPAPDAGLRDDGMDDGIGVGRLHGRARAGSAREHIVAIARGAAFDH